MATEENTLFIHGSNAGGGAVLHRPSITTQTYIASKKVDSLSSFCKPACGHTTHEDAPKGTSTICDSTCFPNKSRARYDGFLCGARDPERFGIHCRLCYTDIDAAREADNSLLLTATSERARRVIMCDTKLPPPPVTCTAKCAKKNDTVSSMSIHSAAKNLRLLCLRDIPRSCIPRERQRCLILPTTTLDASHQDAIARLQ